MAYSKPTNRQYELTVDAYITYADLVSGTRKALIDLPAGARVTSGECLTYPACAGDSTVAAVITDNASSALTYLTDSDAKAAARTAFTIPADNTNYYATGGNIGITATAGGTFTAGGFRVRVNYIIDGRGNEVQPAA